jgi:antitoxin ParD1/3/4
MSTIAVPVPDALRPFVDGQVARHGYRDAAAYFLSLAEADRLRDVRADLEAKLAEAVATSSTPMTADDWAELRRAGTATVQGRSIP